MSARVGDLVRVTERVPPPYRRFVGTVGIVVGVSRTRRGAEMYDVWLSAHHVNDPIFLEAELEVLE